MLKSPAINLALLFLTLCHTTPAFAEAEATMHQVYLAAESLEPGLPFAKPEALQNIKSRIASASNGVMQPNINFARQRVLSSVKNWLPLALLILGIGLVVIIIGVMRRLKSMMIFANSYADNTPPGPNMPPAGASGAGSVMGQPGTGGMGSGMMGSMATGAVLGAGEALMNHFIGGNKNNVVFAPPFEDTTLWNTSSNMSETDDMGGTDFGITGSSSWDEDENSDGGGDWT